MAEPSRSETNPLPDGKRRRFFNRLGIATLFGGLASGAGLSAFAQGRPAEGHHRRFMDQPMDPAKLDERIEHMVKHLAVDIGATPEQTGRLVAIAKSAARELRPLRVKAREARKQAMELLAAPSIDRGAIERLRAEQIQAADAASRRFTQALVDVAEILTPEQRMKLKQHFEKHFKHRPGMHGMHRGAGE